MEVRELCDIFKVTEEVEEARPKHNLTGFQDPYLNTTQCYRNK